MRIMLAALLLATGLYAQTPQIEWQASYGGYNDDKATAMDKTTDGGYIIAGLSHSTGNDVTVSYGNGDIWITKILPTGQMEWDKTLGGSRDEQVYCIRQTSDGGYIVAGFTRSDDLDVSYNHSINNDCWIIKLNQEGNIEWEKTYGGTDRDFGISISETLDNGYIIAGITYSTDGDITTGNSGNGDGWVIKTDVNGIIQWQKPINTVEQDSGNSVLQTTDGGYLYLGTIKVPDSEYFNNNDILIVKISSAGDTEWQQTFGGPRNDQPGGMCPTADGGYIICGTTDTGYPDDFNTDAWVIKINQTGTIEWQKTYGGSEFDNASKIHQTTDGGYIIGGNTMSPDGDVTGWHNPDEAYMDNWVLKIDATGNIEWQKAFGSYDIDLIADIAETDDGGYIVAASAMSPGGDVTQHYGLDNFDYWIFKISPELSIHDLKKDNIALYPNPATSYLTVKSDGSNTIEFIRVRDIMGKNIMEVSSGNLDVSILQSGVYSLEIQSGSQIFFSKFIKD